jgi:carboxyl-terminal processing protease|tara:strand:- start:8643 stop:10232 length:1590 start_codon:yes stop_codon:yes gene_type:complete
LKANIFFLILIILLSVAIGYLGGSHNLLNNDRPATTFASLQKLNQLITYLSNDYVDKINTDSIVGVVIEEIVNELDPHSVYIPAVQKQALTESMQGNFMGIGVSFFVVRDSIAVVRVLEGGPSQKAGLKSGDRILMVDQDTLYQKQLSSEAVVLKLKGPSKAPIELKVYRKRTDSIYSFKFKRGPVPLPSISSSYMINETTGYIKINRFSQTTFPEFRYALEKLLAQKLQNLVLDLRGNPGGYLLPAKQIADDFLVAQKPIVIVEGNNGLRELTVASSSGLFENGGLYVLVDENSASSSEIIAGAIQDNDRGFILGRRTFGKGLVQQQLPLGGGDQIRLTTARYYTPTGRSIQRPYDSTSRTDYYAEVPQRYETGEMEDESNIPKNDSLAFTTPNGRTVYGGGGIMPDYFISNQETPDELLNNYFIRSNILNRFVFLEMDANPKKYKFDNAPMFYNEPLPFKEELVQAFKKYCKENSYPITINDKNEAILINATKAYIAIQLFSENLYNRIVNEKDPFIQKALSEIETP